jgi:N-acyl-D-aspartate/D-glutamate deacylase
LVLVAAQFILAGLITGSLWGADGDGSTPAPLDVLITGGTVYDGTGADGVSADVGIAGDRITLVGRNSGQAAQRTIDATGKIVCPGFIDLHTHSDEPILAEKTRDNLSYATQGCTTIVTGNCGGGHVDVADFFHKVEQGGSGANVAHLVPHGSVRQRAMGGSYNRPPTAEELRRMREITAAGMRAGAIGMSTGLIYSPGMYATTDEIVAIAKIVSDHSGIYATHLRSESTGLLTAVQEALEIGQRAACPVHISHFKASTPPAWGKVKDACALVETARGRGEQVTADQYPYIASSTSLNATLLPDWAREGTAKDLLRRIEDPADGPKLRGAVDQAFATRGGADKIQIASFAKQPAWNGMTIQAITNATGQPPADVVLDILRRGGASVVSFSMCEEDVEYVMQRDFVATASDGSSKRPDGSMPHPRSYGTFPRKIGRYAYERKVVSLAHAIRSATSLPAAVLGMTDRGTIAVGQFADVVVFDPRQLRDAATFERPHQYSTGVEWLFVNGVATIAAGQPTHALPGRVVRNPRLPHTLPAAQP